MSILMSSSISGETNTEANEVWRRLPESNGDLAHQPVHAGLGAQPAVGVLALRSAIVALLMPATSPALAVDDLGLEAALVAPAQVHAHQHLRPVLRLGAAGAGLDVEEALCGSISPRNMRWNSSVRDLAPRAAARRARCRATVRLVVLGLGELQQLGGVGEAAPSSWSSCSTIGAQRGALAAELLRALGLVPDGRVLELAARLPPGVPSCRRSQRNPLKELMRSSRSLRVRLIGSISTVMAAARVPEELRSLAQRRRSRGSRRAPPAAAAAARRWYSLMSSR